MRETDGKFTRIKRWVIGISGFLIAYCSIMLTKQGVGLTGDMAWMGTAVALGLFCAELMFNSNFDELNWTILLLGLGAYLYSIWTNIEGFYFYRGIEGNLWTNFDVSNLGGGLFMDIYPELAIAWAMKESKIGDLFGNLFKTAKDPDRLTQVQQVSTKRVEPTVYQSLPKNSQNQQYRGRDGTNKYQAEQRGRNKSQVRHSPQGRGEPTYHPVGMAQMNEIDLPEFLKDRKYEA